MSETEALKMMANIESETALIAFNSWMNLQWFLVIVDIVAVSIVSSAILFFIIIAIKD